jgi:carboxypeptidase PM20D1
MVGAFKALAPYITEEPLKTLVQDVEGNADAIAQYCNRTKDLFHFASTTIAPTVIEGSSAACNVMPQNMRAVVNFRIAEGETTQRVLEHVKAAVNDDTVELRYLQCNDPSATARTDGYGYAKLMESMYRYF